MLSNPQWCREHPGQAYCPPVTTTTHQETPPTTVAEPTTTVPTTTAPAPECQEDDPCWDCETMGNMVCGPEWDCVTMGNKICESTHATPNLGCAEFVTNIEVGGCTTTVPEVVVGTPVAETAPAAPLPHTGGELGYGGFGLGILVLGALALRTWKGKRSWMAS